MNWSLAGHFSDQKQKHIAQTIIDSTKLQFGIDIIYKFHQYCDVYCFAAHDPSLYLTPTPSFLQYIIHINDRLHHLLVKATKRCLPIYQAEHSQFIMPVTEFMQYQLSCSNLPKKIFLHDQYDDVYLTNKEYQILQQYKQGKTAKYIAQHFAISHRTVEKHLENVKVKLNQETTIAVLALLQQQNIFL